MMLGGFILFFLLRHLVLLVVHLSLILLDVIELVVVHVRARLVVEGGRSLQLTVRILI